MIEGGSGHWGEGLGRKENLLLRRHTVRSERKSVGSVLLFCNRILDFCWTPRVAFGIGKVQQNGDLG